MVAMSEEWCAGAGVQRSIGHYSSDQNRGLEVIFGTSDKRR